MRVFEPLILMEAWSQLAKSKEDDIPSHICSIVNRQFIDDWLDCDMRFSEEVPPAWYLAETDVVLLRQLNGSKAILAKVQSYKRTLRGIQTTLRCNISSEEMKTFDLLLAIHSQWHLRKVWRYVSFKLLGFCLW
jgi:senataxin